MSRQTDVEDRKRENGGRLGRGLDSAEPTSNPHTGGREADSEHSWLTHSGWGRGTGARDPASELCFCLLSVH